jgi:hypothetical protein
VGHFQRKVSQSALLLKKWVKSGSYKKVGQITVGQEVGHTRLSPHESTQARVKLNVNMTLLRQDVELDMDVKVFEL